MKINGNPLKLGMTARDMFLMQNPKFEKNCETWMAKLHKVLAPAVKMKNNMKNKPKFTKLRL